MAKTVCTLGKWNLRALQIARPLKVSLLFCRINQVISGDMRRLRAFCEPEVTYLMSNTSLPISL